MAGIYVASKSKWGSMWINHRAHYPIISTWINESSPGQTKDWAELWTRGIEEVRQCDAMVVYLGPIDVPRGGLYVEIGAALAFDKMVFFVGDKDACSVFAHPNIVHCASIYQALDQAFTVAKVVK